MEQLDELIFNTTESLRSNKKHPNMDVSLGKEKLLNKPHRKKNFYYKMQNNDNSSRETHPPPQPSLNCHGKIDTFDTFYESFLEFKYSVSSKLENFLKYEIQNLPNINKDLKDEPKSYLKLTVGKTIDIP